MSATPVAETTISTAGKSQQTYLNTTGRLDKLPETRDFYAKREFSGDLGGLSRQHFNNNLYHRIPF